MLELEHIGYSSSDDCSFFKCPKCGETYSGWQLLNMEKVGEFAEGIWKYTVNRCKCGEEVFHK